MNRKKRVYVVELSALMSREVRVVAHNAKAARHIALYGSDEDDVELGGVFGTEYVGEQYVRKVRRETEADR